MAVKVKGWKGVAFNVLGPEMVEVEVDLEVLDSNSKGELDQLLDQFPDTVLMPHKRNVRVVMVGDDKVHIVDKDDCTEIPEEDFCHECGQIGCTHDGLDRG